VNSLLDFAVNMFVMEVFATNEINTTMECELLAKSD